MVDGFVFIFFVFFFKQKTAYEMRISDWSSDVCSSDLKRTCAIADRRDLDRKSGRSKADGPILIWRRLLLSSTGASGVASRDGGALDRVGARPCRIPA